MLGYPSTSARPPCTRLRHKMLAMPVRFEINNGMLQVVQSFDFPAVYLDHWAVRLFSSDELLGRRFLRSLKASGGALVVSHVNLAEVTGPDDPRHADEIAAFFEALLPNIYFALFDIDEAIKQEERPRDISVRLMPPPDLELLKTVGRERPDDFLPFTIANLVKVIAKHRDQLGATWHESNQEMADHINKVRLNAETVSNAKNFASHPIHIPTIAVMQELLRPIFLDKTMSVDVNDAGDTGRMPATPLPVRCRKQSRQTLGLTCFPKHTRCSAAPVRLRAGAEGLVCRE